MYVNAKWHTNTAPTYAIYIPSSIYYYYISDHIHIYVPQFTKVHVIHCLIL